MAYKKRIEVENFEDCRILFRNFAGEERTFNAKGKRNFCLVLDPDRAEQMIQNGWNVKWLKPRDEDEDPVPYLKVTVKYRTGGRPPRAELINSKGKRRLTERSIDILDWCDIEKVDLVITPYYWDVNGNTGRTAYMRSIYVTIVEDAFEAKYYDKEELDGDEDYDDGNTPF